jgi:Zn-finger nucleic acid-binding protein
MNCLNCKAEMEAMTLEAHLSPPVTIDLCRSCQAFWFDKYESLKLAAASTLKLLKLIGELPSSTKPAFSAKLQCPRCASELKLTHDLQRNTRFSYWRCPNDHGRFIGFFDFLKEKNFIRTLTGPEIQELRRNIQTVNCSNCGGPIDLGSSAACPHCGAPLSILDMKQPQQLLEELKHAAEPKPIDPALPLELALAKSRIDAMLAPYESNHDWWSSVSAGSGLVEAGLSAFARWLKKSGI